MSKEIQSIVKTFQNTLSGQPWFGRAVYELLSEVNPADVFEKTGDKGHSLIELLYHMITWAEFTLSRLEKQEKNAADFESLDWRKINPSVHSWEKGIKEFKDIHQKIIAILETKNDDFLKEMVDDRKYNYRFLLNGLIQHNIYHLGQIAYINKLN
ncbi:MAG TPA: DinB family protein [Chitinophagaceae bacterium]|nr:DinB family protein [Chitinophagaceae bacterium]